MNQMIDTLDLEDSKRYMHHYNFPPFSTGETGRVGSPRRREIGHGALAERAPEARDPQRGGVPLHAPARVRRAVVQRLDVDGQRVRLDPPLMDAGVPIKAPVGGIAMGMIAEGDTYVTLTDILGAEDALGDMDFKVAGTRVRHRDPAGHEGQRDARRGPRRRAPAGARGLASRSST